MLTPIERQAIMDEVEAGNFDLGDALDDIATKQRGEDVRRAMYGGILLVNHEGKAGAVDVKARQRMTLMATDIGKQIDAIEKEMGQFIANNSGTTKSTLIEQTTLFGAGVTLTGAGGSTTEGAEASAAISLADSITEYDYIDIEYTTGGRTQIVRFTPAQIRQTVHWDGVKYNANNQVAQETVEQGDGTASIYYYPYSNIKNVVFKASYSSADTLNVNAYMWTWTGKKNDYGFVATSISSSDGIKIIKVTGIKHTEVDNTAKDGELTDLRVGYDNTQYNSAGEAVRAQIRALWQAVNAISLNEIVIDSNGYLRLDGGN